ncbi:MAG TPA: phosphoenolpyruvate kinase [Polyangiaceae bacterium]|nr:phosphoenolpyruvate kinase [Polyangiaceae bacterium]
MTVNPAKLPRLAEQGASFLENLGHANRAFMRHYPGDRSSRQPVHTVYGGAQLYKAETPKRLGELALSSLNSYAAGPVEFARGVGFLPEASLSQQDESAVRAQYAQDPERLRAANPAGWLACTVYERVVAKLEREPVEDFRIDFEDGFGARPDEEEDTVAQRAASELARAMSQGLTPPFIGIRIKSFSEEWKVRATRTLDLFLDTLLTHTGGKLPADFIITLPKVTLPEQPATLVRLLELLEQRHGLAPGSLRFELMIETTQALLGADGRSPLPSLLIASEGRCIGAHLGTYDFTASCNITAAYQTMDHPMCDLAKGLMLLAYGYTGIFLSDGATNVMPVPVHRGVELSAEQRAQNKSAVYSAWRLAHRHIRHSLQGGFYQGWDLHPAQLPVRYATCFAFFLEGLHSASERLRNFIEKAAQATLVGDVFDDAATGQGLLNYFLRALNCGAIDLRDMAQTGLLPEEIELRSFAKILAARRTRLSP